MARLIVCTACGQSLTLPETVGAGQQIKCPSCHAIMVVPGAAKPVVLPVRSGGGASTHAAKPLRTDALARPLTSPSSAKPVPVKPLPPSVMDEEESIAPRPKKKKKSRQKESSDSGSGMKWMIAGLAAFAVSAIVLIVIFVPWGRIFSGTPEAQLVDVYTAVNSMGYNNVGVRVMNSDTAAYCIPGPRQIMVTRPNPKGKYLLLRLKVPYADVDKFFSGARGQLSLNKGHIQVEANGVTRDAVFIQDDNAAVGHFQLSFQPPEQEGPKRPLRDYLGPKIEESPRGWSHDGAVKEYDENMTFEDSNGMQVRISVGSERQDGGGGNILEHLTGKKVLGNQQALTGNVSGYVHVDWNQDSGGFIVSGDLEQPNEIGLNWKVNCIVELPPGASGEVTLKVLGKSRRVKIR